MDCQQGHIVLAFAPMRLLQVRVELTGRVRPNHVPQAAMVLVRELSLLSPARPLVAAGLVINRLVGALGSTSTLPDTSGSERVLASLTRSRRTVPLSPTNSGLLASNPSLLPANTLRASVPVGAPAEDGDMDIHRLWAQLEGSLEEWRAAAPTHCLLLGWGGLLSLVDLDAGADIHLLEVRMRRHW
jgi:hypothetical protein